MVQGASGKMTKVAVLGCGKVGRLVCHLLADSGDYEVTAIDVHLDHARKATKSSAGRVVPNVKAEACDLANPAQVAALIKGHDYALSCAPFHLNLGIAKACKDAGVNYLDLTEDVQTTKGVRELAQGSKLAFIPQCGLAPGFITIAAHNLAQEFDRVDEIKMRVGALPMFPHNALKYNLTWSTEGLINEYGNPCEAVVDGKLTMVAPLEGYERFSIDGTEYEAFNTSGGLGSLAETYDGKVRNLNYRSVRYPGHRDIMALLMNDLQLNYDRDVLKKIFEKSLPHTHQDVVLIMVTVSGWKNGLMSQKSYCRKIYNAPIEDEHWGAIQITTAAGITAVLDIHRSGKLPRSGFVRQEDISFKDFLGNRFGRYYA
jgi:saccharopine dehydrogenase-like NADP-dependent oxidoreductase